MKQHQGWLRRRVFLNFLAAMPLAAAAAGPAPQGAPFRIDDASHTFVIDAYAAQAPDGSLAVVYQPDDSNAAAPLTVRRIGASGIPLGAAVPVTTDGSGAAYSARIAVNAAGTFAVVWGGIHETLNARAFAADGTPLGAPFRVDDSLHPLLVQEPISNASPAYAVGIDGQNHILVAWTTAAGAAKTDQIGKPGTIVARRFSTGGVALDATPFAVSGDGPPVRSALALGMTEDGAFVIAWMGSSIYSIPTGVGEQRIVAGTGQVQFQRYSSLAQPLGIQGSTVPQVGNVYSSEDGFVSLSLDGHSGAFAIAWSVLGDFRRLYVQRFTAAGLINEARLSYAYKDTASLPRRISVGIDRKGDFVTAWEDADHTSPSVLVDTVAGVSQALQPLVSSLVGANIGSTLTGRAYGMGVLGAMSLGMGPNGDFTIAYLVPNVGASKLALFGQHYTLP